jgi:hypothetical protein
MRGTANERERTSRLKESDYARLAAHVTERDRNIAVDCYEHHVLTTDQLQRLHFTGARTARARLQVLYELRVLDRFRPLRERGEGTMPHHWILDEAGALIVADQRGIDRSQLRYTHADGAKLAASRSLEHHVEANELFTRLAVEASQAGGALTQWYGVRTLAHLLGGVVVPDGYGVLAMPGKPMLHILLEYDRATETASVLREKARRYADTLPRSSLREVSPLVILAVPSPRRAQTATAAIAGSGAPIAVAVWSVASARSVLAMVTEAPLRRAEAAT